MKEGLDMFGWFKSDYRKRLEEANKEFDELYGEFINLKRENKLLEQVNESHRRTIENLMHDVVYSKPNRNPREFNKNLLEIKLKDTDSVPEVWYKGERLDEAPKGLFSIDYKWETRDILGFGEQELEVKYYEQPDNQFLDMKTVGHKRVGG